MDPCIAAYKQCTTNCVAPAQTKPNLDARMELPLTNERELDLDAVVEAVVTCLGVPGLTPKDVEVTAVAQIVDVQRRRGEVSRVQINFRATGTREQMKEVSTGLQQAVSSGRLTEQLAGGLNGGIDQSLGVAAAIDVPSNDGPTNNNKPNNNADADQSSSNNGSHVIIIGAAAGGVMVVAMMALLIIKQRQRNSATPAERVLDRPQALGMIANPGYKEPATQSGVDVNYEVPMEPGESNSEYAVSESAFEPASRA
eukprot:TRINITY_DN14245_c0_g1_i1.p1 TRINITY_DN14245_c0_g1~~TRINITY_DN14245_c0_g1_i1.p1  ORF type:complete len:293 (+),score=36.73 TRINITY_DN14245_c0_g1_i1:117-881(+)